MALSDGARAGLEACKCEIEEEIARLDARTEDARRTVELFTRLGHSEAEVARYKKSVNDAAAEGRLLKTAHGDLQSKVTGLEAELQERQKAFFRFFEAKLLSNGISIPPGAIWRHIGERSRRLYNTTDSCARVTRMPRQNSTVAEDRSNARIGLPRRRSSKMLRISAILWSPSYGRLRPTLLHCAT